MQLQPILTLAWALGPGSTTAGPAIASAAGEVARHVPSNLVMSALSPRDGEDALSLGVAFFGPMPALDLRYVRGVSDRTAFEGVLSSAGIVQRVRAAVRHRVTDPGSRTPLALRLGLLEVHDLGGVSRIAAGVGPGLVLSYVQGNLHWTAAVDIAWSFLDRGGSAASAVQVHPAVCVEVPIGDGLHLLVEGSTVITASEYETFVTPLLAGALVW